MIPVYQVVVGDFDGHRVVYDTVASFTSKRAADSYARRLKTTDPYLHQYTEVRPIRVYKSVKAFELAERLRAVADGVF